MSSIIENKPLAYTYHFSISGWSNKTGYKQNIASYKRVITCTWLGTPNVDKYITERIIRGVLWSHGINYMDYDSYEVDEFLLSIK